MADSTSDLIEGMIDMRISQAVLVTALRKLGEPMYLIDVNPTAENIARLIFDHAAEQNIPIVECRLWETPHCFATYSGR